MRFLFHFAVLASVSFASQQGKAETVEEYLRAFHENPRVIMERLPSVVDEFGNAHPQGFIHAPLVKEILNERNRIRSEIMSAAPPAAGYRPFADIESSADEKDRPERLAEAGPLVRNVKEMETQGLMRTTLNVAPWADSYWPLYKGMTGLRYSDRSFPQSGNWMTNYQYVQSNPASMIVSSGDSTAINALSPAEKYDFVMGDYGFSLTRYAWASGQKHYERHGGVAKWMGICHGWAAAAHMSAGYPTGPVTVIAANGTPVVFYPQDVKALQSMLWANARLPTRFVGNRCNTASPEKNRFGRIIDPKCYDVNPGTWHLAIVNQMGRHQRSFVMDSTFSAEVWNYPIASYQYSYYNPQSLQVAPRLESAMIPIAQFRLDKFKEFRSPRAKYIVGVYMDVAHTKAVNPSRGNISPENTPLKTIRFIYDLELDENLEVIGGEWYSNAHPDFIWSYQKGAQALAVGDAQLLRDSWNRDGAVPGHWRDYAQRASGNGTPLFSFIRRLVSVPAEVPPETPVP